MTPFEIGGVDTGKLFTNDTGEEDLAGVNITG
jgi:hypothetical protein